VASRLRHFVSRGAMEIEGLGGERLEQLAREGLVSDAASLWDLSAEPLERLAGWGKLSAAKLVAGSTRRAGAVERHSASAFRSSESAPRGSWRPSAAWADSPRRPPTRSRVDGIGPAMAASVCAGSRTRQRGAGRPSPWRGRRSSGPGAAAEDDSGAGPTPGQSDLHYHGVLEPTAPELRERLEQLGATVAGSVSARTSCRWRGRTGEQARQARELSVESSTGRLERLVGQTRRVLWQL
jgi:DNA ligase (NAD+)